MELYRRIKQKREELNMSQSDLAAKLGYKSRSSINKIELGKADIPQSKIKAFADALETTPSYLMGWDDELAKIKRELEALDAKAYFSQALFELIRLFGYEVELDFAEDNNGNATVLLESEKEAFEVKDADYNNLINSSFSFIDYEFNKMINVENRVESDFFIKSYYEHDGKKPTSLNSNAMKKDDSYLLPNAANEIEGASEEDKIHDDAIMDGEDF